jgi:hypothetical protein
MILLNTLVLKLSNNIKNFRLSSYTGTIKLILIQRKKKLIRSIPISKALSDDRIININIQKLDGTIKGEFTHF